jgi:DNA-binding transcriptional ArsR family regulator
MSRDGCSVLQFASRCAIRRLVSVWPIFVGPLTSIHGHFIINVMVNDSLEQLDTVFLALAHPTRRAILDRLAEGEASGTELARPFAVSVPAISKHLRVLEHADLILHRKNGRTHWFRLAAGPMRDAAAWLEHYRHFWEAQLASLDTYLRETEDKEPDTDDSSHSR